MTSRFRNGETQRNPKEQCMLQSSVSPATRWLYRAIRFIPSSILHDVIGQCCARIGNRHRLSKLCMQPRSRISLVHIGPLWYLVMLLLLTNINIACVPREPSYVRKSVVLYDFPTREINRCISIGFGGCDEGLVRLLDCPRSVFMSYLASQSVGSPQLKGLVTSGALTALYNVLITVLVP